MALRIQTTIRNMREISPGDGIEQDEYDALVAIEKSGEFVTVDCQATTGYFDVTLPDGRTIPALSWYHLDGFDQDPGTSEMAIEWDDTRWVDLFDTLG